MVFKLIRAEVVLSLLNKKSFIVSTILFGVVILFCAPWVLASNTPYQKLIISFMWLPAIVHVCLFSRCYRAVSGVGVVLYLLAAAWFSVVVVAHAQDVADFRELKVVIYIGLTLLGFFAVAEAGSDKFKKVLLYSAVFGGFGAWVSCVYFYLVEGAPFLSRHPAVGLWNVIIIAAQAVGSLMLLAVCLGLSEAFRPAFRIVFIVSLLGYLVFIIASQARGVWIALSVAFVVFGLLSRSRGVLLLVCAFFLSLALVFFFNSDIFLSRGTSYRSELWLAGISYALDNWKFGVGVNEVWSIGLSSGEVQHHPHNMFIDIARRFGVAGLFFWLMLWSWAFFEAYRFRSAELGRAALVLLVYSSVVVLTDGVAQWKKPNPGWFVTWIPLALVFALAGIKSARGLEGRTK